MYFEVQTAGMYERLKYAVIIRAIGMMILYALTAAYANQRMPFKYLSTWICIMLTVRMVLGPGIEELFIRMCCRNGSNITSPVMRKM